MPAKAKEEKGCVSNKEKGEKEKKPPMPTHLRVTKYWTQKWVVITAPFLLSLYPNELPSSLSLQLSHSSSPPLFLCSCKIQRTQIQGMPTNIYSLFLSYTLAPNPTYTYGWCQFFFVFNLLFTAHLCALWCFWFVGKRFSVKISIFRSCSRWVSCASPHV